MTSTIKPAKQCMMEEMFQVETQKAYNCGKCKVSFAKTSHENFMNLHVEKEKSIESILEKELSKKSIADKCNSCGGTSILIKQSPS